MKEKKLLERDIQREICEWLAGQEVFFWRHNNTPIYGRSNDGTFRFRAMPKYGKRGLPDLIVLHAGVFHGIEVKRPGRSLSPDQVIMRKSVEAAGGRYYLVHSLEEAKQLITFP